MYRPPASLLERFRHRGSDDTRRRAGATRRCIAREQRTIRRVVPDVELRLTAAPDESLSLPGAPAHGAWRFAGQMVKGRADTLQRLPGSYLGPVIRLRRGQKVRIHFANQLEEDSIAHWHGMDVSEAADGHPRRVIRPGASTLTTSKSSIGRARTCTTRTDNMRTGAQVYQGPASRFAPGRGCQAGALFTRTTTEPGRKPVRWLDADWIEVSLNHRGNTQNEHHGSETESITNQSVAGVVTDTPGANYAVTLS